MTEQHKRKIGVFLSLVLRHKPEEIGLTLNENGWVSVEVLLHQMNGYGKKISMEELEEIVATNDKKRYQFSEDKASIRASQGHSVAVDLELPSAIPPQFLYHGTAERNVISILQNGIEKRKRHHVHLSKDEATAVNVGSRHGKPVVLTILSGEMAADGFKFYISENGVWLTDEVPAKYIEQKK